MTDEGETCDINIYINNPIQDLKSAWNTYKNTNKIPVNFTLPTNAITDASKLVVGKSYKVYQVKSPGYTEKICEIKVNKENTGFIKPPYYLVPTLKNTVASIFGMGGKKSRKYHKTRRHTRRRKSRRNSRK